MIGSRSRGSRSGVSPLSARAEEQQVIRNNAAGRRVYVGRGRLQWSKQRLEQEETEGNRVHQQRHFSPLFTPFPPVQ